MHLISFGYSDTKDRFNSRACPHWGSEAGIQPLCLELFLMCIAAHLFLGFVESAGPTNTGLRDLRVAQGPLGHQ